MLYDKLSDSEVRPSLGKRLQVSPNGSEIVDVPSQTSHLCNFRKSGSSLGKVTPDANLSLVHSRMSLRTIELNAHMHDFHEFPQEAF